MPWIFDYKIVLNGMKVQKVSSSDAVLKSKTFKGKDKAQEAFMAQFHELNADPSVRCEFKDDSILEVLKYEEQAPE